MMGGPADDEAGEEALGDGLQHGSRQHVDPQLGPPAHSLDQNRFGPELRLLFSGLVHKGKPGEHVETVPAFHCSRTGSLMSELKRREQSGGERQHAFSVFSCLQQEKTF